MATADKQSLYVRNLKEIILQEQYNRCAICQRLLTLEDAELDHCHNSDIVRGVLCKICNHGLGYFGDDEILLRHAITYLREYKINPRSTRYFITSDKKQKKLDTLQKQLIKLKLSENSIEAMLNAVIKNI